MSATSPQTSLTGAHASAHADTAGGGVVRIDKSEVSFTCGGEDSITRAGLKAGLGMPYECNAGGCGTCRYELVSGEVEDLYPEAPAWSERDRKRGRRLSCQSRPKGEVVIKLRLEDMYVPHIMPRRQNYEFLGATQITHDIREFKFRAPQPLAFLPGQYALIKHPGLESPRAYSMSNIADATTTVWEFQIRRTPTGKMTAILFDELKPGDTVSIDGPYGHAFLREDSPREVICVAGGSGISPMLSIARGIAASPKMAGRTVHFFMGGRAPRDITGEEALRALPGFGKTLHFHPAVSELDPAAPHGWNGSLGYIHEVVAKMHGDNLAAFEWYFAGPPPMVNATADMLRVAGVPFEQQHFDRYF